jgi:hypothetical protein
MFPLNCIIIVISCCIFIITIIRSLIFVSCFPAFKDYSLLCSTFSSISSSTLRFHIYLHFVNPSWDLCDDKQPTFFHCDFWFLFLWISCFFLPICTLVRPVLPSSFNLRCHILSSPLNENFLSTAPPYFKINLAVWLHFAPSTPREYRLVMPVASLNM